METITTSVHSKYHAYLTAFARLRPNALAIKKEAPPIARATNSLVHSFPLPGAATTRGMCRIMTQSRNIAPNKVAAKLTIFPVAILSAAAKNATPTKYAQNSFQGIHTGMSVVMNLAYIKCWTPKITSPIANKYRPTSKNLSRPPLKPTEDRKSVV